MRAGLVVFFEIPQPRRELAVIVREAAARLARARVLATCLGDGPLRSRDVTEAHIAAGDHLADLAVARREDRPRLLVVRGRRRVILEPDLLVRELVERAADVGMIGAQLGLFDREALLEHRLRLAELELLAG